MIRLSKYNRSMQSKNHIALKGIELAGFKTFAKRTKINFDKSGIVAIVGPNGSGKSNVADAIRWVLGEQKNKFLRTEKSANLIFDGSKKRPKASMAEVVLSFDNTSRKIAIDSEEVEITRRIYRSGESAYLVNGKKASLLDIQEILAKSGFGVGSYTVVGQGMIDKLILSTSNERKLLFDEASGVKQFEIKQSRTLRKIKLVQDNISQLDIIISELKPEYAGLKRQLEMLKKKQHLESDLNNLKHSYYFNNLSRLNNKKDKLLVLMSGQSKELALHKDRLIKLEDIFREKQSRLRVENSEELSVLLSDTESGKSLKLMRADSINRKLEDIKRSVKIYSDSKEKIEKEKNRLIQKLENLNLSKKNLTEKINANQIQIKKIDSEIVSVSKKLDSAKKAFYSSQNKEYLAHSLGLVDILQKNYEEDKQNKDIKLVFFKLRRMIRNAMATDFAALAKDVDKIQSSLFELLDTKEKVNDNQTADIIKLRSLEIDINSVENLTSSASIELQKLKSNNNESDYARELNKLLNEKKDLASSIKNDEEKIKQLKNKISQNAREKRDDYILNYYNSREKINNEIHNLEQSMNLNERQLFEIEEELSELEAKSKEWNIGLKDSIYKKVSNVDFSEIIRLESEVDLISDMDPVLQADFDNLTNKMEFLDQQRNDLRLSVDNLLETYNKTNQKMKHIFERGFYKINKNFGEFFGKMFEGGEARLELTLNDDSYGVDIVVHLPGKHRQNISSLSGGEKALTSLALLAGILTSNPSPFVVLDEVDAALDAQNTKIFNSILKDVSKKSQVFVITHNQDTMSVADELLGITTSPHGDSLIAKAVLSSLS